MGSTHDDLTQVTVDGVLRAQVAQAKEVALSYRYQFRQFVVIGIGIVMICSAGAIFTYVRFESARPPRDALKEAGYRIQLDGAQLIAVETLKVDNNIDESDSFRATVDLQRDPGEVPATLTRPIGKLTPTLVAPGIKIEDVFTDPVDLRFRDRPRWVWILTASRDKVDTLFPLYGKRYLQTMLTWTVNGRKRQAIPGAYSDVEIRHALIEDVIVTNAGALLSFIIGIATLIFGLQKKADPGKVTTTIKESSASISSESGDFTSNGDFGWRGDSVLDGMLNESSKADK